MSRSVSARRRPPIFRSSASSSLLLLLGVLTGVLLFPAQLSAQVERTVDRGEQFTVERSRSSSFLRWSVDSFDARKLSLVETTLADTVGTDQFQFEALESGEATVELKLQQTTVLGPETTDTETIILRIREPAADSDETDGGTTPVGPPTVSDATIQDLQETDEAEGTRRNVPDPGNGDETTGLAGLDRERWNQIEDLIENERFQAARDIINERLNESRGTAKQRWHNKLAQSYLEAEEYEQAAAEWDTMVEQYERGPTAEWKLESAKALREAGMDDQAELTLLEIRHRHRGSDQWVNAMVELGELAIRRGNYERARTILESAREPLEGTSNPRLDLRLARLYDEYAPVRDYERAVSLYESAGEALRETDPEAAQQALDRARHLRENYVNFGFQ
jgi:TolA-binding protein